MFNTIVSSLLKGLQDPITIIIVMLLTFLIWQVTNHLPTQIKDVKQDVKQDVKNVRDDVKDVRLEVKDVRLEVKDDINRLEDKIDNNHKEIMNILLDIKGKPQK